MMNLKNYLVNFKTKWKANLQTHKKKIHAKEQQEMLQCDQCEYTSNYSQNVKRHKKMTHGGQLKCKQCNYTAKKQK